MNLSDNLSSILNKYVVLFADSLVKHHTQLRTKDICDKLLPQRAHPQSSNILQVFKQKKNVIQVKKTLHGNYTVDIPEQFILVMNVTDKVIVGYENEEGMVNPLTKELIALCCKYKLKYTMPLNLNNDVVSEESEIEDYIFSDEDE